MNISKDNQQISIILPKEIVDKLDQLAKTSYMTRSRQAARIIIEYFEEKEKKTSKEANK